MIILGQDLLLLNLGLR